MEKPPMSNETAETPQVVERNDFNNANLLTFEVTWESGLVENVKAHFISHPHGLGRDDGRHITLSGYYDGRHRVILSARPDRVRSIRLLDLLPSFTEFGVLETPECFMPEEPGEPAESAGDDS